MPISRPFRYLGLALLVSAAILAFVRISAQAQTPNPDQLALGAQLFAQNCAACHGQNMGGGNPHIAEHTINPNALLYVALPFMITIPATIFIAAKKKLWTKLDFASLRSRTPKPTN